MVYEERVEQQPVHVCRMVAVQETVRVPRVVQKVTPVTYTQYTPRLVCARIPLDACGNPIGEAMPSESILQPVLQTELSTPSSRNAPTPAQKSAETNVPAPPTPSPDAGARSSYSLPGAAATAAGTTAVSAEKPQTGANTTAGVGETTTSSTAATAGDRGAAATTGAVAPAPLPAPAATTKPSSPNDRYPALLVPPQP